MAADELFGTGWEFPPRFDRVLNAPTMLTGEEDVINSIYVILHTKLGERILRNEFGSNIHELLFEPLNANLKTYMSSTLKEALATNEPRIEVREIVLDQPDPGVGRVDINIEFSLIETDKITNLVIPFYKPEDLQ